MQAGGDRRRFDDRSRGQAALCRRLPARLRGEIQLKRDPGNPAPAEAAFLTALAIAERLGGRFDGLRAALSLAKLY